MKHEIACNQGLPITGGMYLYANKSGREQDGSQSMTPVWVFVHHGVLLFMPFGYVEGKPISEFPYMQEARWSGRLQVATGLGETAGQNESNVAGLSVRDYFASRAPFILSVYNWPEAPRMEEVRHGFTGEKLEAWKGWRDCLSDEEIRPEWLVEFREYQERRAAFEDQRHHATHQWAAKHLAIWAYMYADAMLEARGK